MRLKSSFRHVFFLCLIPFCVTPVRLYARQVTFFITGYDTQLPEPVPIALDWEEAWFGARSASVYNHGLARVACALSAVSYDDVGAQKQTNGLLRAYRALGIADKDMEFHYDVDYDDPLWGNNQCAFSLATKEIASAVGTQTLLLIVVRGTPEGANEWISNFNVSDDTKKEEPMHEGFLKASRRLAELLDVFVKAHRIDTSSAFVLLTGHSRGAAVANLLGADFATNGAYDPKRVYTYTFAAPNVTTYENVSDKAYRGIWNIVNAEDIVPTMPLNRGTWAYKKYGRVRVLVNNWNTDEQLFLQDYLPRMNRYYKMMIGRDYYPFKSGPFIPIQITSLFGSLNKDVESYYSGFMGLHKRINKAVSKIDIPAMLKSDDEKEDSSLVDKAIAWFNGKSNGLYDYATFALKDMHSNETYLAWLLALDADEAYSTVGCSQIILHGTAEGAVLDENDSVLLRFMDGRIQYSSIKLPVFAVQQLGNNAVIGLPGNRDFTVVLTNESLAPTRTNITIEHFSSSGILRRSYGNQRLFPYKGMVYRFEAGRKTLASTSIFAEEVRGTEAKLLKEVAGLNEAQPFRVSPELSFDTDLNVGFGVHIGKPYLYGTVLTGNGLSRIGKKLELAPGIGTQQTILGPVVVDEELLFRLTWVTADVKQGHSFNVVPELRTSLSLKPRQYVRFFVAGVFDAHIDDCNDAAFDSEARQKTMSSFSITDHVHVVPSLQFGIRF